LREYLPRWFILSSWVEHANRVPRGNVVEEDGAVIELAVHAVCGRHVEPGGLDIE
jgi:hypothetical protein